MVTFSRSLKLPFKFSETGLSHGPGGPQYNDRFVVMWLPPDCHVTHLCLSHIQASVVLSSVLHCTGWKWTGHVTFTWVLCNFILIPCDYHVMMQPLNTRLCDGVEDKVIRNRVHDTEKLGVAGFMTEWYVHRIMHLSSPCPEHSVIVWRKWTLNFIISCWFYEYRGAYDNKTMAGSRPYEDGIKVMVRNISTQYGL